jgi:hypothetical protein
MPKREKETERESETKRETETETERRTRVKRVFQVPSSRPGRSRTLNCTHCSPGILPPIMGVG